MLGRFVVGVPLVNNAPCAWWWLPACLEPRVLGWCVLGRFVVGGYLHALELVLCWLVCLVGSWLVCPLLMYLGACVLAGSCPCWFVVRGWLPACLEPRVLLVGVLGRFVVGGYLHALNLVSLVGVSLVGSWLAVTCMPWSLCLGGSCPW